MKRLGISIFAVVVLFVLFSNLSAQGVPAPYTPRLQTFLTGLDRPILIRNAHDGSKRLFIVQQTGIIKVLQPGSNVPTNFINLSSKIVVPVSTGDERGLLGLTFAPDFATSGKFYVDYTRAGDGTTVVAEYKTLAGNPNQGDISTERILFTVPQPFSNHNGGMVEFGPDGYLYIGMGDGGSGDDPGARAQNPAQLLGKLLRIDPNVPAGSPVPYNIPPTNPFTGANTTRCSTGSTTAGQTCQEIWTIGMRNPWRWSFDRGGTHQLWVGDVGQNAIEEVDVISSGGGNYGWRVYEGNQCTGNDPGLCNPANFIFPLFQYTHSSGRCSITGGYVYRGTQGSLPNGAYTYADYCSGEVWMWQNNAQVLLQDTPRSVISFGEDEDGEIYICYSNGQIDKIVRAKASADLDGDLKTDLSIFRPSTGAWYMLNSSNSSVRITNWGNSSDILTPEDYDGDNITDVAVFRPSDGNWYVFRSSDSTVNIVHWGTVGDIPAAGDYDGDAKADFAIFRPADSTWWVLRSSDFSFSSYTFGVPGDQVAPADYDGDGRTDVAIFRPSEGAWYWINSTNGANRVVTWGASTDIAAPGDFDGDGKTDQAVFRPSTGVWYIFRSTNNSVGITTWGVNGDIPQVGDYDGDGKDDIAVYRPSSGTWYVLRSTNGGVQIATWGIAGDVPVPAFDRP
jgi:glucose/arabinose dehydrogenase